MDLEYLIEFARMYLPSRVIGMLYLRYKKLGQSERMVPRVGTLAVVRFRIKPGEDVCLHKACLRL